MTSPSNNRAVDNLREILAEFQDDIETLTADDDTQFSIVQRLQESGTALINAEDGILVIIESILEEVIPEKIPHYQQETERTKREKAYYNKAIDDTKAKAQKIIKQLRSEREKL